MTQYKLITALCRGGGIGYNGGLPWPRLARDMRFFSEMTRSKVVDGTFKTAVLMGRKTWDSLPLNAKPLKNRDNIIISSSANGLNAVMDNPTVIHIDHIDQLKTIAHKYHIIWIVGGASIYEQCLRNTNIIIEEMYITFVDACYDFDIKFPDVWLHDTCDEYIDSNTFFNWSCFKSIPPYLTFPTDPLTHYSIESINIANTANAENASSNECPDLHFLKCIKM